jgi:uncharacterized membrane-anchored protein
MLNGRETLKGRQLLSKVPEVTIFFWIVKIACTTVGETAADFLRARRAAQCGRPA